jgi:hypothetical protein
MKPPPPNPNDAAARAAMREHAAQYQPVTEQQGERIIAEWHNEDDRTFSIDEVKRWFKVALPLSEAARRE